LGFGFFNGLASAFRLMTSGYFQTAAMLQRDLLETIFLLDFLRSNPAKVATWRAADEDVRRKQFGPVKIRIALDKRDGFRGKKREQTYKLCCELAAHPTYNGFRMLAPKGAGAHCGPFLDEPTLKALVAEHAKLALQGWHGFSTLFSQPIRCHPSKPSCTSWKAAGSGQSATTTDLSTELRMLNC
jgi:hypothetical protein